MTNVISTPGNTWWSSRVVQRDNGGDKWWIKSIQIKLNDFSSTSIPGATVYVGSTVCGTFPANLEMLDDQG